MAKAKMTAYFCSECGYESSKWMGQCPVCRQWNTMVEAPARDDKPSGQRSGGLSSDAHSRPMTLDQVTEEDEERIGTGLSELDRVLGGGIVKGSLILIGGDPGIGKSTLLLEVCRNLAESGHSILYISGEESLRQIKLRANRINASGDGLKFLCETSLDRIEEIIRQEDPEIAVIDSIQTMYREDVNSAPGSVSQVRESTNVLLQIAKGLGITVFIVGHVTKEGVVAGPRVLEHMVDTVLYFEGDRDDNYRILRSVKNRFGSTNEIGVFEMREEGLIQVENPSEYLLSGRPDEASGAVAACSIEGTRPILLEVQALVTPSNFGVPRRTAAGTDYNRVNLLMAVLEKRCHFEMSRYDAYVNIAGGVKMTEPALDLAITMALVSSFRDRAVDSRCMVFGEVGLSGEVRAVSMAEQRVREAVKMGFTSCILPKVSLSRCERIKDIRLLGVNNVKEAIDLL